MSKKRYDNHYIKFLYFKFLIEFYRKGIHFKINFRILSVKRDLNETVIVITV